MVHRVFSDNAKGLFVDPTPKFDFLGDNRGKDDFLGVHVVDKDRGGRGVIGGLGVDGVPVSDGVREDGVGLVSFLFVSFGG